jgi:hypothetical protein
MKKLHVALPNGYAAFADYDLRDKVVVVEVHWQEQMLAIAEVPVAPQSFNPYDDPETETAYANAREFARRCAVIHAVIRECLDDDGLCDTKSGMALTWHYTAVEDDDDQLEVEIRQNEALVLEKSYPLPSAVRDFDEAPEDVGALTRTALQPALDDWQRLCSGDTTFPGTFADVMRAVTLPNLGDESWHLGPASQQHLPEFIYRLLLQLGKVRDVHAMPRVDVPADTCILFFGDLCVRRLYLRINGDNVWKRSESNRQSWEAYIRNEQEKNGLLQLFAGM